jgi:hypothetical protein
MMINTNVIKRVLIATYKVDFRRSYDGLLAEAYHLGLDPLDGDLILFGGRCRHKIKIFLCDDSGILVMNKRCYNKLSSRCFKFALDPKYQEIDQETIEYLLRGKNWSRSLNF